MLLTLPAVLRAGRSDDAGHLAVESLGRPERSTGVKESRDMRNSATVTSGD